MFETSHHIKLWWRRQENSSNFVIANHTTGHQACSILIGSLHWHAKKCRIQACFWRLEPSDTLSIFAWSFFDLNWVLEARLMLRFKGMRFLEKIEKSLGWEEVSLGWHRKTKMSKYIFFPSQIFIIWPENTPQKISAPYDTPINQNWAPIFVRFLRIANLGKKI